MKSIMQSNPKECYLCGCSNEPLDKHHIFGGPNRKLSEEDGLFVWLCHDKCHEHGPGAVHHNIKVQRQLQEAGMLKYASNGRTLEDFRERYGRYYRSE